MIETNLVQTANATNGSGSAYDTNVKYLLSGKQILSWIIKYTVEEFREMSIEDIIGCIGDDIEIGERAVDAGLSNLGRVRGTVTEDNVPGEGIKKYQNKLIFMLEELLSEENAVEKKRILAEGYGMRMTAELEGGIHIMCNLSENIIERERIDAIKRMIKANATKEPDYFLGYTEDEYRKAESVLYANA